MSCEPFSLYQQWLEVFWTDLVHIESRLKGMYYNIKTKYTYACIYTYMKSFYNLKIAKITGRNYGYWFFRQLLPGDF